MSPTTYIRGKECIGTSLNNIILIPILPVRKHMGEDYAHWDRATSYIYIYIYIYRSAKDKVLYTSSQLRAFVTSHASSIDWFASGHVTDTDSFTIGWKKLSRRRFPRRHRLLRPREVAVRSAPLGIHCSACVGDL